MAGANKILSEGQILFKAGDQSDGMYLIRKGELCVYLEQNGKEVVLANIPAGSMIGEMALFDKQPRSASVKANKDTEVTHITTADFGKLMRQIPKWFVSLMSSLSGRLRETNERLQRLEQGGGTVSEQPFYNANRMLNVLLLLWHKDGQKTGRNWTLGKKVAEDTMINLFDEDPVKLKAFFEVLVKQELLSTGKDSYNNVVFNTQNKGILANLGKHMLDWVKSKPKYPCLADETLTMLRTIKNMADNNPYDTVTCSLADVIKEGKRAGCDTTSWMEAAAQLKGVRDTIRLVKTSDGVGFKTTKKGIGPFLEAHTCMAAFYKSNIG